MLPLGPQSAALADARDCERLSMRPFAAAENAGLAFLTLQRSQEAPLAAAVGVQRDGLGRDGEAGCATEGAQGEVQDGADLLLDEHALALLQQLANIPINTSRAKVRCYTLE